MGRRSGDQQHFSAPPPPERESQSSAHSRTIGLSSRHQATHQHQPKAGLSRAQARTERAHARYPFSNATLWLSVIVFISFVLASLYWITYIASTQP